MRKTDPDRRFARDRPRLDTRVHELGFAPTREKARALVMAGRVLVGGRVVDKPGSPVPPDARVEVRAPESAYASRGGHKLEAALDAFRVSVAGLVALDVGSSTGGFTDCLLVRGARRVYAVDVGRGIIDARLRHDPRVVLLEGVNARTLSSSHVPEPVDLMTADLAFISLSIVLPAAVPLLAPSAEAVLLVKPQFELGRGEVGRGVVREPEKHARAVRRIAEAVRAEGLRVRGLTASPLLGAKGNREFFLVAGRQCEDLGPALEAEIAEATRPR